MGHSGWENGLEHRQRMDLNSSASLSTPLPPPVHGDSSSNIIQYCSLRCSQQFLVLFHEASLCPSDQDKNVYNVLKTILWLSTSQVGTILSSSQLRKLRPREAKGLVEPI